MTSSCVGDPQGELLGGRGGARVQARRRGEDLDALPVALHRLHHRPRRRLPVRRPRHLHGQLAAHRHRLLGHQRRARGEQLRDEPRVGPVQQPHAPAVVAAAHRLEHHRPAGPGGEPVDVRGLGDLDVVRHPGQPGERAAHHELVLGVPQGVGARTDRHAVGDQRPQQLARDALVVERDDLGAVGETAQRVEVVRAPEVHVGADEGGGIRGRRREHAQRLPQRDGGLVRHPCELPAADHPHDGEAVRRRCCDVHGV